MSKADHPPACFAYLPPQTVVDDSLYWLEVLAREFQAQQETLKLAGLLKPLQSLNWRRQSNGSGKLGIPDDQGRKEAKPSCHPRFSWKLARKVGL